MDASGLRARLEASLRDQAGPDVRVGEPSRLSGGASRESWTVTISTGGRARQCVVRRGAAPLEVELLKRARAAGVPVPEVLWVLDDGFVMQHVDGETLPRRILRDPGLENARSKFAGQCGEILARVHAVDVEGLADLDRPDGDPALDAVGRLRAGLDALGEPHPALELGLRWLELRLPDPVVPSLVHGDFRMGNFVIHTDGIAAVLDWELAHAGDFREDLGWLCLRAWRFGGPDEVGGTGSRADLCRAYEKSSGRAVDPDALKWWEVCGAVRWGVITITQAMTHLTATRRSVELAAIGRRTAEAEYDVLELIG